MALPHKIVTSAMLALAFGQSCLVTSLIRLAIGIARLPISKLYIVDGKYFIPCAALAECMEDPHWTKVRATVPSKRSGTGRGQVGDRSGTGCDDRLGLIRIA